MPERDQTKWLGIRPTDPEEIFTRFEPPKGATYIHAYNAAENTTMEVYKVEENEVFYLTDYTFTIRAIAAGRGVLYVSTGVPALFARLVDVQIAVNIPFAVGHSYNTAFKLPVDYTINIESTADNVLVYASITGYTRPV